MHIIKKTQSSISILQLFKNHLLLGLKQILVFNICLYYQLQVHRRNSRNLLCSSYCTTSCFVNFWEVLVFRSNENEILEIKTLSVKCKYFKCRISLVWIPDSTNLHNFPFFAIKTFCSYWKNFIEFVLNLNFSFNIKMTKNGKLYILIIQIQRWLSIQKHNIEVVHRVECKQSRKTMP